MCYTIEDIKRILEPIAQQHGVEHVWLFGSYARGEARPDSDIDLLIDKGKIKGYFQLTDFYLDLADAFKIELDIVIKGDLWEEFIEQVSKEEILIYDQHA
ncbi:MAG: nucleotidyltransferase domain-containing protein [Deltaproteobacteria bacterium]|jgi:predicted nucleotidyltransferase|nr:nucleotidyltransferase domain-containing protein [Deltaproteobacteria bacterium]